ncbi:MAG: portal protein [Methanobrevibacter sp.]|nr:portal protein [Methanobrevibacter sp.]
MVDNLANTPEQEKSAFVNDDSLYGKKIVSEPVPEKNIGIDTDDVLLNTLALFGDTNKIDMGAIERFTSVSRDRNAIYDMLDAMSEDTIISAALETYTADVTQQNDNGRIVWAESTDENIRDYITFLLDSINVDKNIRKWAYSLCKYGDLYLRLYRESDYDDPIFGKQETKKKPINENISLDNADEKEKVDESVKVIAYSENDKYVHYVDMVYNPATMFELTRMGKTYGYIKAPSIPTMKKTSDMLINNYYTYQFKQQDIEIYQPTEFVHACVEDNTPRVPEEVDIFVGDEENDSSKYTYTVRRGQSMLQPIFKVWREMMLLENSMLLNRVTKSSVIRIISFEAGDMPKEQVGTVLNRYKSLAEQKTNLKDGEDMGNYTNPGPVENTIWIATRNGQGALSIQNYGGDVDVKGIVDVDYFRQKLCGGLRIPQQFLGFTDGATGFNGGTALSINSSRYAKEVKGLQNTLIQALTDAINLMLMDRGLNRYINNFELHMLPPTTQEELDRRENMSSLVGIARDVLNLTDEVDEKAARLKILKSLISDVVDDSDIMNIIQEEIEKAEESGEEATSTDIGSDEGSAEERETRSSSEEDVDLGDLFSSEEEEPSEPASISTAEEPTDVGGEETIGELPTPDSLGLDFTQNQNF